MGNEILLSYTMYRGYSYPATNDIDSQLSTTRKGCSRTIIIIIIIIIIAISIRSRTIRRQVVEASPGSGTAGWY